MDRNDVVLGGSAVHPRIARQRTELVLSQPFFGALALRLNVREDPSTKTFWVDGETLGYNPTYMETLSDLEVRGVVAHEVLHVANGHCWRQGARDPDRWNDACDYAINPIVLSAGMVLPKGALVDPRYTGKSAEEIYGLLTQEAKQKQQQQQKQSPQQQQPQKQQPQPGPQDQQQPNGKQAAKPGGQNGTAQGQSPGDSPSHPGSFGEVRPYKGPDKPVKEAEWKVAVTQAAKAAAMRGKLPGDLQAMAGEAVRPVVDWRAVLHRFAQQSSPSDYSFAAPNRRYLHLGFYGVSGRIRPTARQAPASRC
jgi:predicted metal-dependent peptidase